MSEASAAHSANFEKQHGVKLPPVPVTVEFLQAVLDKRHCTVVDPMRPNHGGSYRWYCSCGTKGQSKRSRFNAVKGGAEHEKKMVS